MDGADELHKRIASEILRTDRPNAETFAELSAAGLCVGLGATGGEKLRRRAGRRTADWRLQWPEDHLVDVEVTVARQKPAYLRRHAAANELVDRIFDPKRDDDLVVHIVDPVSLADRNEVIAAAAAIPNDGTLESPGRWQLRREAIQRDSTVIFKADFDARPHWWAAGNVRCWVVAQSLAGPETTRAPGQVRVIFSVPYEAYINPVMKKADAPQGKAGAPFLIAIDVAGLPGALKEMPETLQDYLSQWRRVSGILLYMDMFAIRRTGWVWRLLANPHAAVPLPESLVAGRANLETSMETGVHLVVAEATTGFS